MPGSNTAISKGAYGTAGECGEAGRRCMDFEQLSKAVAGSYTFKNRAERESGKTDTGRSDRGESGLLAGT